jgi:chromosome segregation ATPase
MELDHTLKRMREAGEEWVECAKKAQTGVATAKKRYMAYEAAVKVTSERLKSTEEELAEADMAIQKDIDLYEKCIGHCKEKVEQLLANKEKLLKDRARLMSLLTEVDTMLMDVDIHIRQCDTTFMESLVVDMKTKKLDSEWRLPQSIHASNSFIHFCSIKVATS